MSATYPDTADGARLLLLVEADPALLPGIERASVEPDPFIKGAWLVVSEEHGWRAVVYTSAHPDGPDFEVEDPR